MRLRTLLVLTVGVVALLRLGGRALSAQARRRQQQADDLNRWEGEGGAPAPNAH